MSTTTARKPTDCEAVRAQELKAMSNNIVVTGATGTIGQRVVSLLASQGANVSAITRDAEKAAPLRAAGARVIAASIDDAASLRSAFAGANTLISITPANARALDQALAAFEAARAAGI